MIPEPVLQAGGRAWSCIPVNEDKVPFFSWKVYQGRVPTEDELRRWCDEYNPPAWAVVAGARGGLVILDFDGVAGVETMRRLGLKPHVRTPSGGFHVYLTHPGWLVRTQNHKTKRELQRHFPGTDIRADGGYAVFWGKTRAGQYQWLRPPEPDSLEVLQPDLREFLGLTRPPSVADGANRSARPPAATLLARALNRAPTEGRNNSGFWLACQLRDNRYVIDEAEAVMRDFQSQTPDINTKGEPEPYTVKAALDSLKQAYSNHPREPWASCAEGGGDSFFGPDASRERTPETFPLTDYGNAQRLAVQHGRDLHYCHPLDKWFVWDGKRWGPDLTGEVMRRAKATVRSIYREAATGTSEKLRETISKHAVASEREPRLVAMVSLAESEPGIAITSDKLDADPWLLNCVNGTIDLKTGTLKPHVREDLITKMSPVEYDASALSELWERVLRDACGRRPAVMSFLQRAVGYSLTGDTREEKLFFIHGPAATGKSTILEAIKAALGDYATTLDFETLLRRREVGGPRNDIARLAGSRFVLSSEVDDGRRLADGLVKHLTGGDTVTARFLYRESFEFRPECKFWLAANRAPNVRSDDEGMWRRILRIPFDHVIPKNERDPQVKATLRRLSETGPAILAWAVRGCLDWQREGLGVPPEVDEATQEYREEMDPLKDFISEHCVIDPSAQAASKDLHRRYQDWTRDSGERYLLGRREFADCLRSRGCTQMKASKGARAWRGIGLRDGAGDGWVQRTIGNATTAAGDGVASCGASIEDSECGASLPIDFPESSATSRHSIFRESRPAETALGAITRRGDPPGTALRPESPCEPFGVAPDAPQTPNGGKNP